MGDGKRIHVAFGIYGNPLSFPSTGLTLSWIIPAAPAYLIPSLMKLLPSVTRPSSGVPVGCQQIRPDRLDQVSQLKTVMLGPWESSSGRRLAGLRGLMSCGIKCRIDPEAGLGLRSPES